MEKIYIQKKGNVITGPYAVEHLRHHQIRSTDKVWYQGLSEWTSPNQIDFLKQHFSSQQKPGFFSRIFR